jgi:hypothetical protein
MFACGVSSTTLRWSLHECGSRGGSTLRTCACSPEQKTVAEAYIKEIQPRYESPIVTEVVPAPKFWPAEDYHQRCVCRSLLPPLWGLGLQCWLRGVLGAFKAGLRAKGRNGMPRARARCFTQATSGWGCGSWLVANRYCRPREADTYLPALRGPRLLNAATLRRTPQRATAERSCRARCARRRRSSPR